MRKIKIKKIILILMFLLCAFIVNSDTGIFVSKTVIDTLFSDSFNYYDTVQEHNWDYSASGCTPIENYTIPIPSVFGTNGMGADSLIVDCDYIYYTTSSPDIISRNDGIILVSMDLASIQDDTQAKTDFTLIFNPAAQLTIYIGKLGTNEISIEVASPSGENCSLNFYAGEPYYFNLLIELNLNTEQYSIFVDEQDSDCVEKDIKTDIDYSIDSLSINMDVDKPEVIHKYIDNFKWELGYINYDIIGGCNFPTLFCDNFNYVSPMSNNNWLIQLGGGIINNSFTPKNDKLTLDNIQNIYPYHETDAFETSYRPDSGSRFTKHIYSPVFSSEFYLNMTNQTDNQFFYTAMEKQNILAYSIMIEIDDDGNSSGNMNWYYLNESQPTTVWKLICGNCTRTEEEIYIKINSLFANRDVFPFNSSVEDDEIRIYVDYSLIGIIENFKSSRTTYISQYEFGKLSDGNYTIDDYYVMVGTDKDTSTFEQYYDDFYIDIDVINETSDVGVGSGDMATALGTIWDDMGILSTASRIMSGLFLMFLLALIMFAMALKMGTNLSAAVLIIVELFFMILLVYIKLLPVWLPFVIVLVAAGIGAAAIKLGTQT